MSIIEIYKPTFELFHEKPVILFQEPKQAPRVVVNLYEQYKNWLNAWTDPNRDKHAPAAAFWESGGPQLCRALRHMPGCVGLYFEWETDRKVAYRWISRKPESPISHSNDWYCICPIKGEITGSGEGRVTVTMPTDEDVGFYFHTTTMRAGWLKPLVEEPKK